VVSPGPSAAPQQSCFHCGLPVAAGTNFGVDYDGARRAMCCGGCEAVARAILAAGLADYYRHRTALAPTGHEIVPALLREAVVYDHPDIQKSFVRDVQGRTNAAGGRMPGAAAPQRIREASLILEGITCAACVWLNEQHLRRQSGVVAVNINYATHRARVQWDERATKLSDLLLAVGQIGYLAHPYDPGRSQELLERERRTHLRRLGVAGVLGAQVMTLSVALYVGDWSGSDAALRTFFYWVSLLLTAPVLAYSAAPFLRAAWRDLANRRAGMDVPVSLGLLTAFAGSVWTTLTGQGVAYYDSVTMFVFLLLGARYFELAARKRSTEASEALVKATPAVATRLTTRDGEQQAEPVAIAQLEPGDRVLVRPGESIPADGVVVAGISSVNEALLTGESLPLAKGVGASVIGGSINIESPLTVRVEKTGQDTVLSAVLRLLDRASAEKPRLAQLADRVAAWFVTALLVIAAAVAIYWWQLDPARVLPITIAVLVVTCPCALSLATPTALTAATGALTRRGLLATRGHALETLARATHFVFDKTGTLTRGDLRLVQFQALSRLSQAECLRIAASLEQHSEHPVGKALVAAAPGLTAAPAENVRNTPGAGLEGAVAGQTYYLGTTAFIEGRTGRALDTQLKTALQARGTLVVLADDKALHAVFVFDDPLRPGARELVAALRHSGKQVLVLSGDHEQAVRRIARDVGIESVGFDLKPDDKLARLRALQADGAVVAMLGDGVNDAPVLAAAQVSIAMGSAAHVSAAAADMILLSPDLNRLIDGVATARRTLAIVRQNLAWAIGYNLVAVPAAAAGFVTPWLAALGMSLSSLLVVANALRLVGSRASATPDAGTPANERPAAVSG
jgi:Cu2+-exporting ATPase